MNAAAWEEALGAYWDEYETLGDGPAARSPELLMIERRPRRASGPSRQIINDPEGNHDWAIVATVDLDASDAAGEPVIRTQSFSHAMTRPPGGMPPPRTVELDGVTLELTPLAEAVAERYFAEFPEDVERYGDARCRGRSTTRCTRSTGPCSGVAASRACRDEHALAGAGLSRATSSSSTSPRNVGDLRRASSGTSGWPRPLRASAAAVRGVGDVSSDGRP